VNSLSLSLPAALIAATPFFTMAVASAAVALVWAWTDKGSAAHAKANMRVDARVDMPNGRVMQIPSKK
jgi:hypothetical protein